MHVSKLKQAVKVIIEYIKFLTLNPTNKDQHHSLCF